MSENYPWEFKPTPEALQTMTEMSKNSRREYLSKPGRWLIYSAVGGMAEAARISKENPPAVVRGLVIDYDASTPDGVVDDLIEQKIKQVEFFPNWIERSLSGNLRLVWVFERELLVPDENFATKFLEAFAEKVRGVGLLAGYDKQSLEPAQVWTNGVSWRQFSKTPVPWEIVFGVACDVSSRIDRGSVEIPYAVLQEELEKRWPGRWQGPFDLDCTGVRFWDKNADNPQGCRVKPDGMQCFTGHTGFMSWAQIFGPPWVNSQKALNLGMAAGETYWDEKTFFQRNGPEWVRLSTEDLQRDLRVKEISNKPRKGQISSDIDRVIRHIQRNNKIEGAAPVVNRKPGVIVLDGRRILNTSTIKAMAPSDRTGIEPGEIPIVWDILSGMYGEASTGPLAHWLAWMKRFYVGVLEYRPLMGQAIFICGPKNCGKTLLSWRVIKPLVGDRAANPYEYFTGQTTFNAELFESPLLSINDEEGFGNMQTRFKFQARLKSFTVNPAHMYHRKFSTPFSVEWSGRLVVTLNDDPESVGVLPEVNSNTRDKLMFFQAQDRPQGWEDSMTLEPKIAAELPLFARFLLEYKVPPAIHVGGRMGVQSYFEPKIERMSAQQNVHYTMLETLNCWIDLDPYWAPEVAEWVGDPTRFYAELTKLETMQQVARDLNPQRCATQLDTLARIKDSGVTRILDANRAFRIDKELVRKNQAARNENAAL